MNDTIYINDEDVAKNKVRIIRCESWESFTTQIKKVVTLKVDNDTQKVPNKVIYRGHALKKWKLSSPLERAFYPRNKLRNLNGKMVDKNLKPISTEIYLEIQKQTLNKFKLLYSKIDGIGLKNKSKNEIWALGRHYGLITPYLDWTENPYVATFFAFIGQYQKFGFNIIPPKNYLEKGNVYVWALKRYDDLEIKKKFEIINIRRDKGSRLGAQAGLFTRLYSNKYSDIKSYLYNRRLGHYLDVYEIPLCYAGEAFMELKKMNITYSSLFPDLIGAAQEANVIDNYFDITKQQNDLLNKY